MQTVIDRIKVQDQFSWPPTHAGKLANKLRYDHVKRRPGHPPRRLSGFLTAGNWKSPELQTVRVATVLVLFIFTQ